MSISYSERQFNDYKKRLTDALLSEGLSADIINDNSSYKQYIADYVDDNIVKQKTHYALQGITHKLAHVDINFHESGKVYPVVNEYKGHDLQKTMYFSKDSNDSIIAKEISVIESKILLS
jgi:hypothetical protein